MTFFSDPQKGEESNGASGACLLPPMFSACLFSGKYAVWRGWQARGGGRWGRKRLLDVETKKDQGETRRKSLIHCSCSVTLRVEMTGGK